MSNTKKTTRLCILSLSFLVLLAVLARCPASDGSSLPPVHSSKNKYTSTVEALGVNFRLQAQGALFVYSWPAGEPGLRLPLTHRAFRASRPAQHLLEGPAAMTYEEFSIRTDLSE